MTTAVIRSFRPDHDLVIVKVDGRAPDVALHVCGSDRSTVTALRPGRRIRFDFQCDGHGQVFCNRRGADLIAVAGDPGIDDLQGSAHDPSLHRYGIPARAVIVRRNPGAARRVSRELTVEKLLAAPIVRR